jgi:penicillin V acylase-like amidase (Ntn superfamily)
MRTQSTRIAVVLSIATVLLAGLPADASTAFLLKSAGGPLLAKNFDGEAAAGMLVVNQRGVAKTALVGANQSPVRWTSRYGSVTFNQQGREFPFGGMNETGLAMESLWLTETRYPEPGDRQTIGVLQWIQYCLDSFRRVDDVVASASELAITGSATFHFLACDATASCAVIEFLDGKLVERNARTLPLPVLSDDTYATSLDYLNRTLGYGGEPVTPEGIGSLPRFARAANGAHAARSKPGDSPITDAFAVLADVAQPKSTRWSIVYELTTGRINFRTAELPAIRSIDLSRLDLDCTADRLMLDLATEITGDVTSHLTPYTPEADRRVVEAASSAASAPAPGDVERIIAYPEGLLCTFSQ